MRTSSRSLHPLAAFGMDLSRDANAGMAFLLLPRRGMYRRGLTAALHRLHPVYAIARSYSNKLFVGGLSFRSDEESVRRAFSQHGQVVEVKLITDRETGRPKGFGFVTFESEAEAEAARSKMTGQLLDGRVIRVDKAAQSRPSPPPPGPGFNSGSVTGSSFASPVSSSLPPVSEDWGTIPSNVVDFGSVAPPNAAATPALNKTGFDIDASKAFDSSTFGQAAASWPTSTQAVQGVSSSQSAVPSSGSSSTSTHLSYTNNPKSETFGSASTFSANIAGSSDNLTSNAPSMVASSTSIASSAASTFGSSNSGTATVASEPKTFSNNTDLNASTFGAKSFNSSMAATQPGASVDGTVAGRPNITIPSSVSSNSSASDAKSLDSSVTHSASGTTSTAGSPSSGTNSASVTHTSATNVDMPLDKAGGVILPSDASSTPSPSTSGNAITSTNTSSSTTMSSGTNTVNDAGAAPNTSTAHPLNSPVLTSSGTFDFSNFSFNNSTYRDNDPPLPRRRPRPRPRPAAQTMSSDFNSGTGSLLETRSPFGSNNQFAESSIPKPKGTEVDFGLLNITASCPPGMRPQGTFDIYIPDDLPEIPPPEPKPKPKPMSLSMFPLRQLPPLDLPYHTPEADNWSDIGKDPPKYDLSTLFPSMGDLIKKEKEFHWDPFDFDPEATLPPPEEVIIIDSDYD